MDMRKPEGESLLKPIIHVDDEIEISREESCEHIPLRTPDASIPLIDRETDRIPPLAIPENDEDEIDGPPGITVTKPDENDEFLEHEIYDVPDISERAGGFASFPHAPGFGPNLNGTLPINPESLPDVNIYQHKKTVAQGMMDLALFSANANQLRYVLESSNHTYYYPGIVLISISLLFQVAVGVGLLWNSRYDVKDEKEIHVANKVNNFTVVGIFLVTVINVFISAFGTTAGASVS